jgi:hypothetical protein
MMRLMLILTALTFSEVAQAQPIRFPIRWSVEDNGAAFIVKDTNGRKLAYVYYEEEPGRRSSANAPDCGDRHSVLT